MRRRRLDVHVNRRSSRDWIAIRIDDDDEVVHERSEQRLGVVELRGGKLQRGTSSNSCSEMIDASDVSLSSVMNSLPIGGIAIRIACGTTTRRMMLRRDMPSARPASSWPGSTDMRPARMISEMIGGLVQRQRDPRRYERREPARRESVPERGSTSQTKYSCSSVGVARNSQL